MIKIAIWKPSDLLLKNIKKLDFSHEIVGIFDDEKIESAVFDFVLISFEDFRNTKKFLCTEHNIPTDKIYTFEEYWVKGSEETIIKSYHNQWDKIYNAHIGTFSGKTVVITGGNSGIGKEAARAFLSHGANVIIIGRNKEKLQATCNEYKAYGNIKHVQWDISNISNYEEKFSKLLTLTEGTIDVLVNSAGIWDNGRADFFTVTENEFDDVININLKSTFFLCQFFAKYFIDNRIRAHIVNVASNVGTLPTVKPYGISKWGVIGLTKGLGLHLAEYGITVNGVAPGAVATPLSNWKEGDCPARRAARNGRIAFPCEIAEAILNLAGYTGENFIGEVVVCDGGDKQTNIRL